ncbi:MAG: long-chain-fatty-acid--CoA ligase [Deferribacteraceae bacterium]|nr:long-chain-fatty-acid--CoA ligase [Deferribacteraceae bacterium]
MAIITHKPFSIGYSGHANLFELFSKNAQLFPKKKYLFFKNISYTYKEMKEKMVHTAKVLVNNGVEKGRRVALLMGNSPEYLFAYFGAVMLGAVMVPMNIFLTEREIAVNMNDCEAEYMITSEQFAKSVAGLRNHVGSLKLLFTYEDTSFKSININSQDVSGVSVTSNAGRQDLASLVYTSGTTGKPKGVMLTHNNLLHNAYDFSTVLRAKQGKDRFVCILPMFHSYTFMGCIVGPLVSSSSVLLFESVMDATKSSFKKALLLRRPSVMVGVPQIYSAMAKKKVSFIQRLLFPFRLTASGGASLPRDTMNAFYKNYGQYIVEGYGLSEASPIVSFNPVKRPKPGSVGLPFPNLQIKIVDKDDNELPFGQPGELCVKGDSVMQGYWNQPVETANVIRNGWLHTGDIAVMDEEGYFAIVDRIKDMIITKGINVYPSEIEELLYLYPGVNHAAVIGVPETDGSETIIAYVTTEPGAEVTEKKLKDYTKKNLAAFKVPKTFVFIDTLPMTQTGKVLKRELKKMVMNGEIRYKNTAFSV